MPKRKRIHQLAIEDRPREKMQRKGAAALSDFELLEALIGNGTSHADVGRLARRVLAMLEKNPGELTHEALLTIPGVGPAITTKILASLELARRHLVRSAQPLRTVDDVLARLADIRNKQQEHLICITLDGGQRLIAQRTITIGILDSVHAHPREIFADAVADRAASIVVAHNHPSQTAAPSHKDFALTQHLTSASHLLGITLRDHLIVTRNEYYSFREHHWL